MLDIQRGLDFVRRELEDFDSLVIRKLLVELYVKLFKFLTYALSFFCSRKERLKASFNKNFYDKNVDELVKDVWKTAQNIHDEARHITQGRIRNVDLKIRNVDMKLDLMMAAMDSHNGDAELVRSQLADLANAIDPQICLGFRIAGTLGAVEQHSMYQREGELRSEVQSRAFSRE